jgi:hypothetical protein
LGSFGVVFQADKKEDERRFQVVETSVRNFLFIRTNVDDPVRLVTDILVRDQARLAPEAGS